MNNVTVYLGVVWVIRIRNGWFTHIKAFPQAIDKSGEVKLDHPDVLKYIANIPAT